MKKTPKQITAIIGIALLLLLYIATLVIAILDFPGSDKLFAACLLATIAIPLLLWLYIGLYGKLVGKKTIADLFPESDNSDSEDTES